MHGLVPAEGLSSDATKGFAYRVVWNARENESGFFDAIPARRAASGLAQVLSNGLRLRTELAMATIDRDAQATEAPAVMTTG